MEKKILLGYSNCLAIASTGYSGGLALLWNFEMPIAFMNFSKHHIHTLIDSQAPCPSWKFTGIYVYQKAHNKQKTL